MVDFAKDLFPDMLRKGLVIRGYRSPEYIKDIGTPARLDRACADFRSGKIARASLETRQPMVFIDRDGTINREVDHLRDPAQLELLPGVAPAIKRLNESDYRCCVVSNQPVVARGECSEECLREIHAMETLLGQQGAFLDRIYYCPHHPDRGFAGERPELKIDCSCRKPKTGMIEQAAREFNVAIDRSWLIGDTSVDMETARRAGLKSVLVESGYAGLDYRTWASPDFVCPEPGSRSIVHPRQVSPALGVLRGTCRRDQSGGTRIGRRSGAQRQEYVCGRVARRAAIPRRGRTRAVAGSLAEERGAARVGRARPL